MSLRTRLALTFGALACIVSIGVSVSAFRSTGSELSTSIDTFLANRAGEVADGIRTPPEGRRSRNDVRLPFDPDSIVQSLDKRGDITGTSSGELPVSDATRQIATGPRQPGGVDSRYENITIDGEAYRMYVEALTSGGAVQVARATTEGDSVLSGLLTRFVVIGVSASLAAAAVGWLVAQRTTRPLRRLADVASVVADTGDFSTEVGVERHDEIGTLARSFQEMLSALESSRTQQHRLVHDAGHELRTPLTSLRANVDLLGRARDLPATESSEILAAVKGELVELTNLFNELMELATDDRSDAIDMANCDLADIAVQSVERWQRRTTRPIRVTASPSPVRGNQAMLERALTNLLGNADKFSPPGEPIDVVVDDRTVAVRDRGPGVPPADRERVFDRFYRSDATRTMPGSGLGLAIVARIIEHHGGSVWAADAPGGGAEVGFRLPE